MKPLKAKKLLLIEKNIFFKIRLMKFFEVLNIK